MSRFKLLDRLRGSVLAGSVGTSASEDKLLSSRESHPGVIPDYPGISRIKTWVMPSQPSPGRQLKRIEDMPESSIIGIYEPAERPSAGSQTVSAASVDSLGFHLAIIGLGVFIGYLIHSVLVRVELLVWPPSADGRAFFDSFPLFPLCMIGGLVVQLFFANFTKRNPLDHRLMQRLSGTAMDFLVVAAISTINVEVVLGGLVPLAILVVAGVLWNVFCVMWLARRLLPADSWFERAIAEMGQSMGVTATGLLLLRVVDPEGDTDATSAFGYKQLMHEPFMGGGLWTSAAIPLALAYHPVVVLGISAGAVSLWLLVWALLFRGRLGPG